MNERWANNFICALPAVLALALIGMLCLSYTQKRNEGDWVRHLVTSAESAQGLPIGVFTQGDFRDSIDSRGRASYSGILVLYVGAFIVAAVSGLSVIAKAWGSRSWMSWRALRLIAVSLSTGAVFSLFQGTYKSIEAKADFWSQLVSNTISDSDVFGFEAVRLHLWLDALGISLATFLALTVTTILYASRKTKSLSNQMQYLRLILYVGSAFLVCAILRLRAILQWSVSYVQPTLGAGKGAVFLYSHLNDQTLAVVAVLGLFYTCLLAAIYVPGAILLNSRRESEKSALPLAEQLLRLAAILGPLLAGPLGEFLGRLG
jgi:hypothetical protein